METSEGRKGIALKRVTFLLMITISIFFTISSLRESSTKSKELEMISLFELRRSRLLKHCARKKRSESGAVKNLQGSNCTQRSMKNLHVVENLPTDLVFCLTKKAGSTSLGQFFVNNLEPADEMAWMSPFVDQVEQAKYVESRSSLHLMMMMD